MKVSGFDAGLRSSGASTARALRRRLFRRSGTAEEFAPDFDMELEPDPFRWQTVTILAGPQQVAPDGRLPAPLTELAGLIETRLEPAPGGRGTQLSARTRPGSRPAPVTADSAPGKDPTGWKGVDPARQIRIALQHARQLIEVGEVLAVEPQPAGKRRRPARGLLVDLMTGDADQEGVV
ncbi:MAG: hypothetical protein QOE23_2874 [Pseudonocardiales bacterium]|jgi:hypothetical protein|nr:hypothetical protein [Pseudonocardiales bacterium]